MNYIPYNSNIIIQQNYSVIVNIIKQLPLENLTNFKLKQLRLLYNSTRDGYDFNVYYSKVHLYNNLVILVKCNNPKFSRTDLEQTNSNDSYVFGMFSNIKYSFQQSQTSLIGFNDRNSIVFSVNNCLVIRPKSQRGVDVLNGYPTCFDLFTNNKGHVNVNELTRMFNVRLSFNETGSKGLSFNETVDFNVTNIEVYKLNNLN